MPASNVSGVPLIMPWADTRPIAGTATGTAGNWYGGVWASWPEALVSGAALGTNPPWGSSRVWRTVWAVHTVNGINVYQEAAPNSTGTITIPSGGYLEGQGLKIVSNRLCVPVIMPYRRLGSDPIASDIVDGGVSVTLGGITARNTHSQRRHWSLDLLLDGPLDVVDDKGAVDHRYSWPYFLRWFEKGITIYLTAAQYGGNLTIWDPGAVPPLMPYGGPYYWTPPRITGQLVDATSVRWAPGVGEMMMRWAVTITIAEQEPPGRIS